MTWYRVELDEEWYQHFPDINYYIVEIVEWCQEYCSGDWRNDNNVYLFQDARDATAFRLRWT